MRNKKGIKTVFLMALCLALTAPYAFAGWEDQPGPGMRQGMGMGQGPQGGCMMGGGRGMMGGGPPAMCGPVEALTKEQKAKLDAEIKAFDNATDDLRRGIFQKGLDMEKEFANKKPSLKNALAIQKEISALQADLDLKWIEHRIKMQEICPAMSKGHGPKGRGCPRFGGPPK